MSFIKTTMFIAGSLVSSLIPVRNHSGIFFFFPSYHTGGAEKVHLDIVRCFEKYKPWVFFTNRSEDKKYKSAFSESARTFDLWMLTSAFAFLVGLLSGFLNRHKNAVVFGCNNVLYYHVLPRLRLDIRKVDLIHAFGGGIERVSLGVLPEIDARIVITPNTRNDLMNQYREHGIDDKYLQRVVVIENKVYVPDRYPKQKDNSHLKILYVGRGTEEKRVNLVGKTATLCKKAGIHADFTIIGDVIESIEKEDRDSCKILGKIDDQKELASHYLDSDCLILTSKREGFPIVMMEAMAHGVVPISTDVGGISLHVEHGVNGMLIRDLDEAEIVREIMKAITVLEADRELLGKLSKSAYQYAKENFVPGDFCLKYKEVLLALEGTDGI